MNLENTAAFASDLICMTWLLFILGAMVAGFVQGLTGFAFALIAMSFWVWVLPPQLAAPLLVFASIWSHVISLSQEQKTAGFIQTVGAALSGCWFDWRVAWYLSVTDYSSRYLENDLGISFGTVVSAHAAQSAIQNNSVFRKIG